MRLAVEIPARLDRRSSAVLGALGSFVRFATSCPHEGLHLGVSE